MGSSERQRLCLALRQAQESLACNGGKTRFLRYELGRVGGSYLLGNRAAEPLPVKAIRP